MKKTILMLSIAAFCFSCGGGSGEKSGDSKSAAGNPDIEKGLELVAKSDCLGCHKIKEASVGPAYNLIGQKYENTEANINTLAEKVQKGGSGNWGQVPMAGHSGISKEDAVLMVKYVLSLKDEK
ncbi:c-type cytochrome [Ferruginibacter profundus]